MPGPLYLLQLLSRQQWQSGAPDYRAEVTYGPLQEGLTLIYGVCEDRN